MGRLRLRRGSSLGQVFDYYPVFRVTTEVQDDMEFTFVKEKIIRTAHGGYEQNPKIHMRKLKVCYAGLQASASINH